MSWGCLSVEVFGGKKWTVLRPAFYFGDGYERTREQAEADVREHLRACTMRQPQRSFRLTVIVKEPGKRSHRDAVVLDARGR